MFYTVGEMAKKLGVAPSALRYYDNEGLLPFVERSDGGIRMFQDKDYEWLYLLECLKKSGMSIKEMKEFASLCAQGDETITKRLEFIDNRRMILLKHIKSLLAASDMLDYQHWYYETARVAGTCAVHEQMPQDQIPAKFREIKENLHKQKERETTP